MNPECFALLDDASPDGPPGTRSRLYTGHAGTLRCASIDQWPALLDQMRAALARGQYAVTLLRYELGAALHGLAPAPLPPSALAPLPGASGAPAAQPPPPALAQVLLFDHCAQLSATEVGNWLAARSFPVDQPAGVAAIRASVDQPAFAAALARIHDYIEAGDTYQVNYTYRLRFDAFGSLFALYARLRGRQPVPYGALVALDDGTALLSLSPELFARHSDGALTARPMKGTAPAAPADQPDQNAQRAAALAADPKNRAENLMIVDLLRNDIGRIAQTGSVHVPRLFDVNRYSSVLQMTSTIEARLRDDATLADIFQALYPCGSITGAPKRRTMEIIAELEPDARGIYTGAIGWFDPVAPGGRQVSDFCMAVPIRTLALQAPSGGVRRGEMGVGAGIVFDSDTAGEFDECRLKARFLTGLQHDFELFETMHASRAHGVRHRARHLARMAASAAYFGFPYDAQAAGAYLDSACAMFPAEAPEQPQRLKLSLNGAGAFSVQHAPLAPLTPSGAPEQPVRVLLAPDAIRADELFLRHKTSVRSRYDAAWRDAEAQGCFDTLFFNQRGELTEGGRSNVLIELDGRWLTPPLSCGVLPGVMRAVLLDDPDWRVTEAVITRPMLAAALRIVLCNALRGVLAATL